MESWASVHPYGHTGVVLDATMTTMHCLAQNYNNKMYVVETNRAYSKDGLVGVWRFQGGADKPSNQTESQTFAGTYRVVADVLNVRSAPTTSAEKVATYTKGQTVNLDSWYTVANGYVWGRYTSSSGQTRFVAIGRSTGKAEMMIFL